jgi:hypothetical protein
MVVNVLVSYATVSAGACLSGRFAGSRGDTVPSVAVTLGVCLQAAAISIVTQVINSIFFMFVLFCLQGMLLQN